MKTSKFTSRNAAAVSTIALCFAAMACISTADNSETYSSTSETEKSADTRAAVASSTDTSGSISAQANVSDSLQTIPPVNPSPPVSAVQQALKSDASLSFSARHVEVSAQNNQLVLRGAVDSQQVKDQVEQKARQAASGWTIDNRIAVAGQASSSNSSAFGTGDRAASSSATGTTETSGTGSAAGGLSGSASGSVTGTGSATESSTAAPSASASGGMGSTDTSSTSDSTDTSGSLSSTGTSGTTSGTGTSTTDTATTTSSGSSSQDLTMAAVNPNPPVSAVQQALTADTSLGNEAKNIAVSAESNKIVLRGKVSDRTMKLRAETRAQQVAGSYQIINEITIKEQGVGAQE